MNIISRNNELSECKKLQQNTIENYSYDPLEKEVLEIDHIHSIESNPELLISETDRISYSLIYICVLLSDSCRGILFSTLWLNVSSKQGNKFVMGMIVAAFSFGRIISSTIFGILLDRYRYKFTLLLSNTILVIGSILYSQSQDLTSIFFSQFIMGLGAGNLSVTRSFVTECSSKHERTSNLAFVTSLQYFGFAGMPLIGSLLSSAGKVCDSTNRFMNEYSLPATVLAIVGVLLNIGLLTYFTNPKLKNSSIVEDMNFQDQVFITLKQQDTSKLIVYCLLNIVTKGSIGVFETLGSEFATTNYKWSSLQTGLVFSISGLIGACTLLSFNMLSRFFKDFQLMTFGMIVMILSCTLLFVHLTSSILVIQFYFSVILMYASGYPIGHTALLGMFSNLTKLESRGYTFGIFGSAGSLARIIFPVLAGYLSFYFNDSLMFGLLAIMLSLSVIAINVSKDFMRTQDY